MIIFSPKDSAYGAACWSLRRRKSICDVTGNSMAEPCDSCWSCNSLLFLLVMSYCQLGCPSFRPGRFWRQLKRCRPLMLTVEGQEGSGFWLIIPQHAAWRLQQPSCFSSSLESAVPNPSYCFVLHSPLHVLVFNLWFTMATQTLSDVDASLLIEMAEWAHLPLLYKLQYEWSVKSIIGRSHVICITFCSSSLDVCWEWGWW